MEALDLLIWVGVFVSIGVSIVRALNVGYQQHLYVLSGLATLIHIYNGYNLGSSQIVVQNIFYLLIAMLGFYMWAKK